MGLVYRRIRIDFHRPKLQTHETLAEVSDPGLAEEGRTRRNDLDPGRNDNADRNQDGKRQQDAGDVQNPFPEREMNNRR